MWGSRSFAATLAFGFALAGGNARAAAPNTVFTDLSAQSAANGTAEPAYASSRISPRFVDLTAEPGKAPAQLAAIAPQTTRSRFIDLTAGTSTPFDNAAEAEPPRVNDPDDPLEEWNRRRFRSHVALHRNVIAPVEHVYIGVVPEPVRGGLHNVLTNLESPTIVVNDLLQVDLPRAAGTVSRFVINTTIGIGGIFDIAAHVGIPFHDNDFGITLANYGVGSYPYLMIPLIGPTNPRDLTGKFADFVLNPMHFVTIPGGLYTSGGEAALHQLDKRSEHVDELEEIQESSPDPYFVERDLSRERRRAETGDMPTFYADVNGGELQ